MSEGPRDLSADDVRSLLAQVGQILQSRGLEASIYVVDGAAMALEFEARRTTRDVDAAIRAEREGFWEAAAEVAARNGLSTDWVNSNAAAFMTNEPDTGVTEISLPGLRVAVASPEHLVAMKLRAMRRRDMDDLEVLFRHMGITAPEQAAAIHDRLFDDSYIGATDHAEALLSAAEVFRRAEALGHPIVRSDEPRDA